MTTLSINKFEKLEESLANMVDFVVHLTFVLHCKDLKYDSHNLKSTIRNHDKDFFCLTLRLRLVSGYDSIG